MGSKNKDKPNWDYFFKVMDNEEKYKVRKIAKKVV